MNLPCKVLCIDGKRRPEDEPDDPLPEEGETYTVIGFVPSGYVDIRGRVVPDCYFIEELQFERIVDGVECVIAYETNRFIPLSTTEETEKQQREQTRNLINAKPVVL